MQLSYKASRIGLLNSSTRIPFRYGSACLTRCPQAVLEVTIETDHGVQCGYAADCLPPSWFDKSPDKDYEQQITEMLAAIDIAESAFAGELKGPRPFFPGWIDSYEQAHGRCAQQGFTPLLASFGHSLVERALLDAICRTSGRSFAAAVRGNLIQLDAGRVHPALNGVQAREWLPAEPRESVFVRHTVGLTDPLTVAEISPEERLSDGLPQAFEEHVQASGVRYFKIKVCNKLDQDLDRLLHIARLVERHRGNEYQVTLDGNEQYKNAEQFAELVDAIRREPGLATLWKNTIVIEQPLERSVALSAEHTEGIRELSRTKRVIIDESDGDLQAFPTAIALGYGGVSSKSCKGAIKSLLNAGLIWHHNQQHPQTDLVITAEDLCTVGVVALQTDLCLAATIGVDHVERNGHHYHPGLSYLGRQSGLAALDAHGDLYHEVQGTIVPRVIDGRFEIASLQCPGFGFRVEPDMEQMQDRTEWSFSSLGL